MCADFPSKYDVFTESFNRCHCLIHFYIDTPNQLKLYLTPPSADPEGGTGGPEPPGKSQDIWVSIGNKQLDPHPPPHGKNLDPLWNLEK